MKYQGEVKLDADKSTIWNILSNLDMVSSCFPGIKSVTKEEIPTRSLGQQV
jgi:Uncharacterized conserved protein